MHPDNALAHLVQAAKARGVTIHGTAREPYAAGEDLAAVWKAFCALAHEPATEPFANPYDEDEGGLLRVHDHVDSDLLLHESSGTEGGDDYRVTVTRQFSLEDDEGEYAGMQMLALTIERFARSPEGRVPQAQRWGYAGPRRADVDDEHHPELGRGWAGHVSTWAPAVEASRSWQLIAELGPGRVRIDAGDI